MSHHHSIRNLLNIKDKNITFDENFCSTETIKKATINQMFTTFQSICVLMSLNQ